MTSETALAEALGVSYAAGLNVPATVAILGIAEREGWVATLPAGLEVVGSWWIIALAGSIYLIEFAITLVPGLASIWETFQSVIRPPAAAVLAAATVYHLDPNLVVPAALLGGGLAVTTHGAKLGLRFAVDASPEPVTNAVANFAELATIASVAISIWHHPYLTLSLALLLLILLILLVRRVLRAVSRVFSGGWKTASQSQSVTLK
jgi:hypothetical protein